MRENLRAWAETIETFVLEVIFEERHDFKARLMRGFLFGGSKLFQGAVKVRRWLYNVRILRDKTLGVQVIAIGNLTVGGTGKTPVVEKFARELQSAGRKVAILSRGYRSKPAPIHTRFLNKILLREDHTPPRIVSDGKSLLLDSELAGDEPYMLASNLKDVVVLVDKDRVKSGRYAIEKYGCDTLLLDDGFQYWDLRGRRHDVVLIDRQQPFGNEHLLPRGTLREPPSHLARAHTIFITKSDGKTAELRERIAKLNATAAVIECVHQPLYFEDVFTGERKGLELLAGIRAVAAGGKYMCQHCMSLLIAQPVASNAEALLGRREIEVLTLIAAGLTSIEISKKLFIALGTVEVHRRNIMRKLDQRNVAGLTQYAIRNGLISV